MKISLLQISPSEDCSRVKKFGVYKVRVEGPWVEEGKARRKDDRGTVAVKLKVEGGRYGKRIIHTMLTIIS